LQKYNGGKSLPNIPKANPIIKVPKFQLSEYAPIESNLIKKDRCKDIKSMEDFNMGWGSMIYETTLPEVNGQSTLLLNEAHDYAQIFINGNFIGKIDRSIGEKELLLPSIKEGSRLTILIEAMGRINFGQAIKDYKGITKDVLLKYQRNENEYDVNLKNWNITCIPDDYQTAINALNNKSKSSTLNTKAGNLCFFQFMFLLVQA
jgi:beta-galactosidase